MEGWEVSFVSVMFKLFNTSKAIDFKAFLKAIDFKAFLELALTDSLWRASSHGDFNFSQIASSYLCSLKKGSKKKALLIYYRHLHVPSPSSNPFNIFLSMFQSNNQRKVISDNQFKNAEEKGKIK